MSELLSSFFFFPGWYEGERIRDGQTGWFPALCTVPIDNAHIRARNLKQRYRLLQQVLANVKARGGLY